MKLLYVNHILANMLRAGSEEFSKRVNETEKNFMFKGVEHRYNLFIGSSIESRPNIFCVHMKEHVGKLTLLRKDASLAYFT